LPESTRRRASGPGRCPPLGRAAALYDGWLPYLPDPARYASAWNAIRDRASQLGRDVIPGLYATIHLNDDESHATDALDAYLRAYYSRPLTELVTPGALLG
jgi:alkanesulfonate monooxygenase SsuD/methylene tetrahydromethanopterin reductase-like flavin-dependent oxidoreductase (luciferase family)